MGIDHDTDSVFLGFSDYSFENFKICIVVLMSFRFEPFPSDVESNWVESPFFQIDKVFLNERSIAIESISDRMIGELFVYNIDAVHNSDTIVLVS